jgi:hypothetical protein
LTIDAVVAATKTRPERIIDLEHNENENSDGLGSDLCAGQRLRGDQQPS